MRLPVARAAFIVISLTTILIGCASPPISTRPRGGGDAVRIGLSEGASRVELAGPEDLRMIIGASTLVGRAFTLTLAGDEIRVTGSGNDARGRKVLVSSNAPIRVGNKRFRGAIEVFPRAGGLTVVNVVAIEDYLCGVVPPEIGYLPARDIEAMKAQALAARTYIMAHYGRRIANGFDIYADTRDQVYGGVDAESDVGNRAVAETRNHVITYEGRLIEAYYHSTCGGSTVNIADVWDSPPVPYLSRVYDADDAGFHCAESPHFRWVEVYSGQQARELISGNLRNGVPDAPSNVGRLRDVSVEAQALSGRTARTRIVTEDDVYSVRKDKIRLVLRRSDGANPPLRSSYIRIFPDRTSEGFVSRVVVSGAGYGHGIGMCQWGAIGMARKGYTAEQIVQHYYRGTQVTPYEPALAGGRGSIVRSIAHIDAAGGER